LYLHGVTGWASLATAGVLMVTQAVAEPEVREIAGEVSGFQAELGLGLAFPAGQVGENSRNVSDVTFMAVPFDINAGYRFNDAWAVGFYFIIAPAFISRGGPCSGDTRCSGGIVRTGLHAQYHFSPRSGLDPWLGLGAGWEFIGVSEKRELRPGDTVPVGGFGYHGPVFADARFGIDLGEPNAGWGPYLGLALGQFRTASSHCEGCTPENTSMAIDEPAIHAWISLGVQGRLVWTD
jgi:hypothetical protein